MYECVMGFPPLLPHEVVHGHVEVLLPPARQAPAAPPRPGRRPRWAWGSRRRSLMERPEFDHCESLGETAGV